MKETEKFVFFWGHEDMFSNFHQSPFIHKSIAFRWAEQALMFRKSMLFGAGHVAKQILAATTPKQCKDLGRSREIPFNQEVWDREKFRIYKEVLIDKFLSSETLRNSLLSTGDKVLAEASPFDKIWGIGLSSTHPDATNPIKWKGQNLLGKVLMEVRDVVRATNCHN